MPAVDTAVRPAQVAGGRPDKRLLLISNPRASAGSFDATERVSSTLASGFDLTCVMPDERGHATELSRDAAADGYDVVVAMGGDGTVNEAANGIIGSDTALACLPTGRTNVFCRSIGVPLNVAKATARLLTLADSLPLRTIDTGTMNGRHFVFAAGIGLGAAANQRMNGRPGAKRFSGPYYFTYAAARSIGREYLFRPPRLRLLVGDRQVPGMTVIAQNSDPLTYFGRRPIRVCEGAGFENGSISLAVLKRASPLELLTLPPRLASDSSATVLRHSKVEGFAAVDSASVEAIDSLLPVEVDGEYVGAVDRIRFGTAPRSLRVVA